MAKLTAESVEAVFMDCLFRKEEIVEPGRAPDGAVLVDGVLRKFGFQPDRLESHRQTVRDMLAELPIEFHKNTGGGWSFLNACMTRDGTQWGEHRNMEQLFVLAIGLGLAGWLLPREVWSALPGSVPYVVVDLG
jgi:hypothetical protein